jgi:integrase
MAWVTHTSGNHWRIRYRHTDGTIASEGSFTSLGAANQRARELTIEQRSGTHRNLARGRITFNDWLPLWWPTLNVDPITRENYQYIVAKHLVPRFGPLALTDIHASDVNRWRTDLLNTGYRNTTVRGTTSLLSRILDDAAEDGLIHANPVHHHRNRGPRAFHIIREMLWATPEEVLRGALQAEQLSHRRDAIMIITAAWTGMRWGEIAGLQRHNVHIGDRLIIVDPDHGALKEGTHDHWLGPPKTPASARTITLPAFLAILLKHHLATHDHLPVFPSRDGDFLWRRNWIKRIFNPAFDGNRHILNPAMATDPIRLGLTFHELRHSHKTWLIAAGIPEIAQARRLGHRMDKRIVEVYSHVADEVEARIQATLKQHWLDSRRKIAEHPTAPPVTNRDGIIRRDIYPGRRQYVPHDINQPDTRHHPA